LPLGIASLANNNGAPRIDSRARCLIIPNRSNPATNTNDAAFLANPPTSQPSTIDGKFRWRHGRVIWPAARRVIRRRASAGHLRAAQCFQLWLEARSVDVRPPTTARVLGRQLRGRVVLVPVPTHKPDGGEAEAAEESHAADHAADDGP